MNVSDIGQGQGSVATLLRPNVSGEAPQGVPRADARVAVEEHQPKEVSTWAWFDLNGDGKIVDDSPLYGGDGVLVWNVSGAKPGHPRPQQQEHVSAHPAPAHSTPAVVEHARAAYSRYGQASAPVHAHAAHAEVA
jgi:hypothetical protein